MALRVGPPPGRNTSAALHPSAPTLTDAPAGLADVVELTDQIKKEKQAEEGQRHEQRGAQDFAVQQATDRAHGI